MPRILIQSFSKIKCTYNVFFIQNATRSHNTNRATWLITSTLMLIRSISPGALTPTGTQTPACGEGRGRACAGACAVVVHEGACVRTRGSVAAPACCGMRTLGRMRASRRAEPSRAARHAPTPTQTLHRTSGDIGDESFCSFFFLMYHNEQETYVMKYFQRSIFNYHLQSTQL